MLVEITLAPVSSSMSKHTLTASDSSDCQIAQALTPTYAHTRRMYIAISKRAARHGSMLRNATELLLALEDHHMRNDVLVLALVLTDQERHVLLVHHLKRLLVEEVAQCVLC
mmetsp:Transcript_62425/g.103842  ORF Transcript_62425/g.103842 Transcript_62425/m.103842 type:complete len:112 (-) Transcript_62425:2523-2858(-)